MRIIILLSILSAAILAGACSSDSLDSPGLPPAPVIKENDFDKWLSAHFVTPYNVRINYKYHDSEVSNWYNLAPAEYNGSIALAKMIEHVWMGAYVEVTGAEFLKRYCPRIIQLVGSVAYNSEGELVLGSAEGGIKIILYNVNEIDIEKPNIKFLNFWFFKTMHHEFAHILHQLKNYSTDFNLISAASYKASNWVNLKDIKAPAEGFVSGYASKEPDEDFVEILSIYVTSTEADWQALLERGKDARKSPDGRQIILKKFEIVKEYLKTSWEIDIEKLREIVLKRTSEIPTLDLKTLK